ncbi:MAG: response regulator [Deltaproteobacteria bacterium]|nr:MAG: response regulator [Deltaproteobacteria bacterium]
MDANVARVLIVDDDQELRAMLAALMHREGLISLVAPDGGTALEMVPVAGPDLLLVDVKMPGIDGMEVLKRVKETDPRLPVVLITAYAEIPASVAAMRAGAFDYLAKPFDHAEVIRVVRAALAERERQRKFYADRGSGEHCLRVLMGPSDAVTRIIREVNRVAQSDFSVIIQGETGASKELVARAIYQLSRRGGAPFIPLDCGSIPETLIESELFGYQKGAFTGAAMSKMGKFGEFQQRDVKGVYGFSVKVGLGDKEVKVEPFGNIRRQEETGETVVQEIREPVVDVFEEKDHTLVVAEMPGISVKDVRLEVKDDLLTIHAEKGDKKYRKEILLLRSYPRNKMKMACNNGILEIKCVL